MAASMIVSPSMTWTELNRKGSKTTDCRLVAPNVNKASSFNAVFWRRCVYAVTENMYPHLTQSPAADNLTQFTFREINCSLRRLSRLRLAASDTFCLLDNGRGMKLIKEILLFSSEWWKSWGMSYGLQGKCCPGVERSRMGSLLLFFRRHFYLKYLKVQRMQVRQEPVGGGGVSIWQWAPNT